MKFPVWILFPLLAAFALVSLMVSLQYREKERKAKLQIAFREINAKLDNLEAPLSDYLLQIPEVAADVAAISPENPKNAFSASFEPYFIESKSFAVAKRVVKIEWQKPNLERTEEIQLTISAELDNDTNLSQQVIQVEFVPSNLNRVIGNWFQEELSTRYGLTVVLLERSQRR